MNFDMLLTICLVILSISCLKTHTTTINLEHLLEAHGRLKDDLTLYICKEEKKLSFVKRNLAIFKREHEKAMKDITGYLGNPINAFTLIKRLTKDVQYLRESVKVQRGNFKREDVEYPSHADLVGAAQNLANLLVQETYELDVKELAEGNLKGVAYSVPMTAGDCYELGRLLYKDSNSRNAKYAREWFIEAYRKYKEDDDFYPFTKVDIIKHISLLSFKIGDIENGLQWTQLLLDEDPQNYEAQEIVAYFKRILSTENKLNKDVGRRKRV